MSCVNEHIFTRLCYGLNFRALEFMQVFLAEVVRGEKDLAVAAGMDFLKEVLSYRKTVKIRLEITLPLTCIPPSAPLPTPSPWVRME